jgi:hypothetical protein
MNTKHLRLMAVLAVLALVVAACGGGESTDTTVAGVDETTATT